MWGTPDLVTQTGSPASAWLSPERGALHFFQDSSVGPWLPLPVSGVGTRKCVRTPAPTTGPLTEGRVCPCTPGQASLLWAELGKTGIKLLDF